MTKNPKFRLLAARCVDTDRVGAPYRSVGDSFRQPPIGLLSSFSSCPKPNRFRPDSTPLPQALRTSFRAYSSSRFDHWSDQSARPKQIGDGFQSVSPVVVTSLPEMNSPTVSEGVFITQASIIAFTQQSSITSSDNIMVELD